MSTPSQWLVANKSVTNLERGVLTRVFYVKDTRGRYISCPRPTITHTQALNGFRRALVKTFVAAPTLALEEIPGLYVGRKRGVYQRAVDSFLGKPLNLRDAEIAAHTKSEKINISIGTKSLASCVDQLQQKDPRVIQARTPRYNAVLAKYLKTNEHRFFQAINRVFQKFNRDTYRGPRIPTVMKGLNATQQGVAIASAWETFVDPVGIRVDASRFDQHCSGLVLEFEHSCYIQALCDYLSPTQASELRWLLRQQLRNKCYGRCPDGVIRYIAEGRMSGDMNTGLGNVIIMCALMYGFFQQIRAAISLAHPGKPAQLVLINNGDDCCMIIEREFLPFLTDPLESYFLSYGFEMTVEGFAHRLEEVKFCQSHPIWTPEGYRMVRTMPMCFAKDAINLGAVKTQTDYDKWRSAISSCGLALTRGIPMAQAYYQCLGRGVSLERTVVYTTGMEFLAHGMTAGVDEIHPRTRVSVYWAFGITPDMQLEVEQHYNNIDVSTYSPVAETLHDGVCGVRQPVWV